MTFIKEISTKDISSYRGDEELIEEIIGVVIGALSVDSYADTSLEELSSQKCLYGLERWKSYMKTITLICYPPKWRAVLSIRHDLLLKVILFLKLLLLKNVGFQAEPSRIPPIR